MKNNIINILLLLIVIIFSCYFNNIFYDQFIFIIPLLISISLVMLYKKVNNKIYNIISLLLLIFSILISIFIIYNEISCTIDYHCMNNYEAIGTLILFILLITLLLLNIIDIKINHKKTYYILFYLINFITIIIFIRYYNDSSLINNYTKLNSMDVQNSYIFITQNYIYFNILYISLLIYYLINKKK